MSGAHQSVWKLDTIFLAVATVALIFSWMAHPGRSDAAATRAGTGVVQLSSAPSAALRP